VLKQLLRVLDDEQLDRIHAAALRVLETTGLQIHGPFLLRALVEAGCRVDFARQRAWFRPELVEQQIGAQRGRYRMVRSSLWHPFCRELPEQDVAWPDAFSVEFGFGAPWLYDVADGRFRSPGQRDQIEMIRLGDALEPVKAVCAPFVCADFDPRIETIESSRLLLLHTRKPGWVGTSSGREVPHLAEFAALAAAGDGQQLRIQPPIFVNAYCTTSPLKIGERSCQVLEQALKYGFPVNLATMPILGGTTPVTPAGSAVVATAEILGGIAAVSLVDPEVYFYATSIAAEMDMRTTQVCYGTPAAVLTDAVLHQLFRFRYGIVLNIDPAYVEAKVPGIQAASLKLFRQMALACTAACPLPAGLLDNGSTFSPAQAMIDLEMNEAVYRFSRGIEVDDESLAVGLIEAMEFCDKGAYIQTEHTLRHFREVLWDARILDRTYRKEEFCTAARADEELLQRADRAWRDLVAAHRPVEVEPRFRAEVERITRTARKELLG
jgi:trimethylamine--corrinoid protein Co-methyltransferase